jgi:hypothetical protein
LCLEGNGAEGGAPQFNCLGHVIDVGAISPAGQNLAKSLPGGRYGQRPSRSLGLIVLSPLDHPLDRRPLPPAPQANGEEASIEEGASSHEYSSERATHASSIVRRRFALAEGGGGRRRKERGIFITRGRAPNLRFGVTSTRQNLALRGINEALIYNDSWVCTRDSTFVCTELKRIWGREEGFVGGVG